MCFAYAIQLIAEAGLDLVQELGDHIATTLMGSKTCKLASNTTDRVDMDKFGEAILKACNGLSKPQVCTMCSYHCWSEPISLLAFMYFTKLALAFAFYTSTGRQSEIMCKG